MQDVCRACFSFNDLRDLNEICSNNVMSLTDILMECCSIKVERNDGFSQKICLICIKFLHIWCNFKRKCIETQNLLTDRKYLKHFDNLTEQNFENNFEYLSNDNIKTEINDLIGNTLENKDNVIKKRKKFKNNYKNIKNLIKNWDKKCLKCDKEFSTHEKMRFHYYRNHLDKDKYKCKQCNSSFMHKELLFEHKNTKHKIEENENRLQCSKCNKTFSRKYNLYKHMKSIHNTVREKYPCPFCSNAYLNKESLTPHIEASHQDKINQNYFLCSICGEKCIGKKCIRCIGKMYKQCTICEKKFHISYIACHMNKHNNIRPYKCSYCNVSFFKNFDLKVHQDKHYDIKRHVCNICSKKFTTKSHLKDHERLHTGVKPFACEYCEKSFTYKNQKVRHVRKHFGDKPFKCKQCEKSFYNSHSLTKHVKKKH